MHEQWEQDTFLGYIAEEQGFEDYARLSVLNPPQNKYEEEILANQCGFSFNNVTNDNLKYLQSKINRRL